MALRMLTALVLAVCALDVHADTLTLANGDKISGEVVEWAVDYVVIEHPQLGRLRLALDQLEIDTGKPPTPGVFGTRFLRGWKRHIDLGLSGKEGDGGSTNIRANLAFNYEDPFKRWNLNGRYFYQDSGDDQDNNARVDLVRDFLFPETRWFAFLAARYQFDEFEAWKHRNVLSGGPAYHLVNTESHRLDTRVGPTYTREWESKNKNEFEGLVALDYAWTITERATFTFSNQFYAAIAPHAGDLRNLTLTELRIRLTQEPALSLNVGAENEFTSNPDPGDDKNVLNYYMGLGLDF